MRKGFFPRLALSGIRKNRSIYYPYILTAVLTTAMMYIIGSLQQISTDYSGTLAFSLQLGIVVTSVFSVVFLFYTNSFLMRRRKKEFGLYNILGMEKRHLARLIFWETALMLAVSLTLGLAVGVLLDKLMHLVLSRLVGQAVSLTFAVSPGSMRYTAALISITFALILLNSVRQVYVARPVELLRSAEVGEREPKARWLLGLLGLISLGTGYWLSATVKDAGMMILFFFVAVLLVIAGTYLLFTSGSITLLKALRKNRRYYYKPDHFISVSGMIYRMKQNAVGLANICILSTGVLLVLSTTVSLYAGMKDIADTRFPTELAFTFYESSPQQNAAMEKMVEETAAELDVSFENYQAYQSLSVTFLKRENELLPDSAVEDRASVSYDDLAAVTFISAETYARMTGGTLSLADNETAVYHAKGTLADSFRLMGEEFTIAADLDEFPVSNMMANTVPCWFCIVVSSDERLAEIDRLQKETFDYSSDMQYKIQFDVSGGEEEASALYDHILSKLEEAEGVPRYLTESRYEFRQSSYLMYGSMLFLGIYLGSLFLMATVLIIYYKQIIEGYEDRGRYEIMKKVGMDKREIKRSIKSQILILFFLPLGTALIHCVVAFPLMRQILQAFYMNNTLLFAGVTAVVAGIFSICYVCVYSITARSYYHIVS